MKAVLSVILTLLFSSVFSQKTNNEPIVNKRVSSDNFSITLEGNSDLNFCFGDLEGRVAWIPPGIDGGVPFEGLDEINNAILNNEISSDTPYIDPNSTGNYYLGPFIYLDDDCDAEYNGNETLIEDINALSAGCYLVYVIDAVGNQSDISNIIISHPTEITTLIPLINHECNQQENGSIEVQISGGTPFSIGEEYVYIWSGPNDFSANTQNINELTAGTYTLIVKDANDCSKTFNFSVDSLNCGLSQIIDLQEGWSIISTYIDPYNNNVESIFNPVVNNLEIMKDENGNVYWPIFGLNSIGNLTIGEGYQVKMNSFNQITVEGNLIPHNTPIIFNEGWNLIGYLHPEPGNTVEMMNSIVLNQGPLKILKNGSGNVYWPEFGLNSIGNMIPGEGYQIKLENLTQFSYPSISARYENEIKEKRRYFKTKIKTDHNMIIGIPKNSWETDIYFGDEIGAFDNEGNLIGSTIYNDYNLAITIWGDDILSEEKDGAKEGEEIKLKLWNSYNNTEKELFIVWEKGNQYYTKNGINIVKKISSPNTNSSKEIISTYDLLGRKVIKATKNQIIINIYNNGDVKKNYLFR